MQVISADRLIRDLASSAGTDVLMDLMPVFQGLYISGSMTDNLKKYFAARYKLNVQTQMKSILYAVEENK